MSVSVAEALLSVEDLAVSVDRAGARLDLFSGLGFDLRPGQIIALTG
jgi:ABC-type glutathione transport system ATPase component